MKKKVFSLMMTLLLAFIGVAKAEVVTIGEGTTTYYYYPVNTFFNYSLTEELYTPEEIGTAGTINAISFYYDYSSSFSMNNVTLYMKNVARTSFASNTDMEPLALSDIVWTGTFSASGAGWVTITLDTPFAYDGTSNLLVAAFDGTSGYPGSAYKFRTTPCDGYKGINWYSDSYTPDPYNTGSGFSGSKSYTQYRANIQIDITPGGGGGAGEQLFAVQNGEMVDTIIVGARPNGAWMEPFTFQIRNTGAATTITHLDWTPQEYFTLVAPELPVSIASDEDMNVQLTTGESDNTDWQMVAIYGNGRTAAVWNITAEPYDPAVPDVWELACEEATTSPFDEVPATAHNVTLYKNYNLPFTPEYPDGYDAVYKLEFDQDVMLNAYAALPNGGESKVVLYTEDFYGEGGPMVDNYYQGPSAGGGATGGGFEAMIGDETSTTTSTYFPFHTLWNYSLAENLFLASELNEAGVTTAPMTSLSWYVSSTTCTTPQNNISIWMGNVSDAALTSTSHTTAGMTLVYSGTNVLPVAGQWNEFEFNAGNFAWDGHSNILILCQRNNGSWQGSVSWQTHNPGFAGMAYAYTDNTPGYDATTSTYSMTVSSTNRANIIFKADGRAVARESIIDFEDGNFPPEGWTDGSVYNDWYVDTQDYWNHAPAYNGTYSLYIDGNGSYSNDYFISPAIEFNGAGTMSFAYATPDWTGDQNDLSVAYGTSLNGPWNIFPNANELQSNSWQTVTIDLSSLTGTYYIAFISYDGYGYCTAIDDINIDVPTTPTPGPTPTPAGEMAYGPVITNAAVEAGTYYLVAAAEAMDYAVHIDWEPMPCPLVDGFAFNPTPADDDDEVEPGSVTLRWNIPDYATGWRLIFGSTYYPDPNHPQTVIYPEDGSFSTTLANSYTVRNLWNNTNYFWRVEFNNEGACPNGVSSPVWGFTTHLNIPQNLTAEDYTVFNDETIVLNWNAVVDRTYRQYNVYRDGELIGSTQVNNIGNTTYTDGPLAYNMGGYTYYVTAVYDEGESAPSDPVTVKVSGYGDVDGHVFEQDGTTGIANATVTMVGEDEFGDAHTYNFTTNGQGYYSGHIYAGTYDGQASCNGYQTIDAPVQGNPIAITYNNTTSPIDYILDENFDPVCQVIAEYYPDSLDPNSPYVKVYWGCGLPGGEIIEDFETGDFSMFDWQVDSNYPWSITTNNPYEGTYCMKSGGAGVASVTSNMTVTVDIPADGLMSFFGKISSESNYDYGRFFIDGVEKGNWSGAGSWAERTYDIAAGTHIFQWRYTKDGSVNSNDDCFYVDYINFYKQPEPAQPGWHTYCESEFNNAVGSNLTTTPSWAYEYPAAFLHANYAGWNITKVSLFSDNMYSAVGGNYTCRIYVGGTQPAAGSLVSELTVDVPSNQNAWVDWDLTTPVSVTGNDPIWVVWTANSTVSSWPAGCCGDLNDLGTWWDGGSGWEHLTYGTWTMRHWFTNRAGRSVVLSTASQNNLVSNLNSNLRTHVKGEESNAICANENAVKGAALNMSNTRRFSHYRVYRTNCYTESPYTLLDEAAGEFGNTRVLSCEVTDTVYIDTYWNDPQFTPAGVYKWGVGVVYVDNRGEEYESEIVWATPTVNGTRNRDQVYDFEDGQIPAGWTNSAPYPWTVSSDSPTGSYCIKSSNSGVASSTSSIQTTVDFAEAGTVSFDALCQGEGTSTFWDHCDFSIDGTVMLTAGANVSGWNHYSFPVAAGSHTFMWSYTKDSSVNPTGDAFSVDNVAFSGNGGGGGGGGGQGGQPGTEPVQEPRESVIVWSNCLDKDMYLDGVTVTVLLNSADSPEGTTVTFTNTNEYEQQTFGGYDLTLDESGYYAFETFRRGEYNISVRHEGYEPIDETRLIWDNEDLRYVMIEILYGVENVYVSRTGWAMWDDSHNNPGGGGGGGGQGGGTTSFSDDFESGLSNWNAIDADGDGNNWYHSSQSMTYACYDYTGWGHNESDGFAVSSSYTDCTYDSYDPNNFLVTNQKYSIVAGSTLNFWADYGNDSYPDHFGVAVATADNPTPADFTIVWEGNAKNGDAGKSQIRHNGDRYFNWRSHSVDLSAYAGQDVYIAFRHFNSYDQYEIYIDDVELTTGAKNTDEMQHFEYYKVMCTSIDGVPIYNHNTVYPFCQLSTNEPYNAPLVEGEHYLCKVATVYSTGMSAWSEPVEWEYEPCDHWGPVDEVTVDPNGQGNLIEWVFEHGFNPYDPGTGPEPPVPGNNATIILTAGDVWGDGSGYQMLLDADANAFGTTIPETGALSLNCSGNEAIYAEFEYKIPTNADGNCSTQNMVMNNSVSIEIPAGTYDWCITNPTPGDRIWIASAQGNVGGRQNDYVFEAGSTYEFTVSMLGSNDAVNVTITGGAKNRASALVSGEVKDIANVIPGNYGYVVRPVYSSSNTVGQNFVMTSETSLTFNMANIANYDERVYFLYKLMNDRRFSVINDTQNGVFVVNGDENLNENFVDFIAQNINEFSTMDKYQAADMANAYKAELPNSIVNALMMDLYIQSRENNMCEFADPFCTDNGMYEFPAGVNAGSGEAGPDYDCLYTQPNPAWYYMRIGDPGAMNIHMYSTPQVDIDFCCWGPFDDPTTPCPYGLTEDKVVSCSYSTSWTENCMIPATAQTGEYYILVITNYSNQPCNINFSMIEGSGSTDCGILPPVDIIGFLITMDGEYLAFAGPTDREFLHEGEYGEHEYCVRPIYPGEMTLPSNNFGWSMGCPVCNNGGGGQITCEAGAPINSELVDSNHIKVWWGEEPIVPGVGEWYFYDNGVNEDAIGTNGGNFWWGVMFPAGSYQGNMVTKVAAYDYMAMTGNVTIYNDGANAPANAVGQMNVTMTGSEDFVEYEFAEPVVIDPTKNVWVVFYNGSGATFPAAVCANTGDANGRWVSLDGNTWEDLAGYGLDNTFMVRAYIAQGAKGEVREIAIEQPAGDGGVLALSGNGARVSRNRASIVKYNVYRSADNETYEFIGEVAEDGSGYYELIDSPTVAGTYYYQVTAVYDNDCESDPALAADGSGLDYVYETTTTAGIDENGGMAIFPNPTKGNVTIQAAGMQHITVVSVLGQVVYDADVAGDELILNMSKYTAGMYTVRVMTENGVRVERITVIR